MSSLSLVSPRLSVYHAGTNPASGSARYFVVSTYMTSSSDAHQTRAKLQKLIQQEFNRTIRGEIKTATDDLKETNKGDLEKVSKDLIVRFTIMVVAATIVVSLVVTGVGFYVYVHVPEAVKNQVHDQIDPIRGELVPIRERLTKLETTTDFLEKLKKITAQQDPAYLKDNLALVVGSLHDAKQKNILLDPKDVEGIGNQLISLRDEHPEISNEAWDALGQVMDYRSFLNYRLYAEANFAKIRATNRKTEAFKYSYVPTGISYKFKSLIFENVTQDLDWIAWENVIFRNCTIRYNGNETTLKNVAFENCDFRFTAQPQSIDLSKAVLASNIVNLPENQAYLSSPSKWRSAVLSTSKYVQLDRSPLPEYNVLNYERGRSYRTRNTGSS